jgi:hypothetical protein
VSGAAATLIEKTAANPADLLSIDPPCGKCSAWALRFVRISYSRTLINLNK